MSAAGEEEKTTLVSKAKPRMLYNLFFFFFLFPHFGGNLFPFFFWEKTKDDKSAEWRSVGAGVWDQICF